MEIKKTPLPVVKPPESWHVVINTQDFLEMLSDFLVKKGHFSYGSKLNPGIRPRSKSVGQKYAQYLDFIETDFTVGR